MKLQKHPEYTKYLQDRETIWRCRQAVDAWRADGETICAARYDLCWTHERALNFVRSLVRMFRAYNRVLWEQFPYCRACGGGCCVLDASHVGPFDGIALALLDLSPPLLPEGIAVPARACIYLRGQRCVLPVEWRTVKCWSFYCLGGRWDPGLSLGEHHGALARALKGVISVLLPEELRCYEQVGGDPLVAHLDDPTDLAQALDDALFELLVEPLHARYPLLDEAQAQDDAGQGDDRSIEEDVLAFVAQAMERLCESGPSDLEGLPVSLDQLFADLELLEWIVVGRPANQAQLLADMSARYAGACAPEGGAPASLCWQMHACLDTLSLS
jgi:hypothetical protein